MPGSNRHPHRGAAASCSRHLYLPKDGPSVDVHARRFDLAPREPAAPGASTVPHRGGEGSVAGQGPALLRHHPAARSGAWPAISDPVQRLTATLTETYAWYRRAEAMLTSVTRDIGRAARAAHRRRRLTFTNRSRRTATNTNRWDPRVYPRSSKSHDGMARPSHRANALVSAQTYEGSILNSAMCGRPGRYPS